MTDFREACDSPGIIQELVVCLEDVEWFVVEIALAT
jgi:hypothetical protein